mgnify:CR=1 FL=1
MSSRSWTRTTPNTGSVFAERASSRSWFSAAAPPTSALAGSDERIRSIGRRRYMADVSRLLPITYAVFMFMVLLGMSAIYLDIVDPIG